MLLPFAYLAFSALLRLLVRRRGSHRLQPDQLALLRHRRSPLSPGGTWVIVMSIGT
jgi:hypothetical protein